MNVRSLPCLILLSILPQLSTAELKPDFGVSATFSIVAVDPKTGECGAAVASRYPAVGKVVPYVRAGVGAFCTQHWHNPRWGERALDLLAEGRNPEDVLGLLLKDDPRRDKRQLAIIDMQGRAANRNPAKADAAGIYWGAMSGRFYACQGNTLAGRGVVAAMAKAYEETTGSLTDRLMAALVAADQAGGDHRGRLAAGIRIAKTGHDGHWFELYVDKSDDAVTDLLKKYVATDHPAKGEWRGGQKPYQMPFNRKPGRQPWSASKIKGSPEPPKPFVPERVFAGIPIRDGLEMVALEGRLFVMTRQGKIWSFEEDTDSSKADLFVDLKSIHPKHSSAYGMAFHPEWKKNRLVFLAYTVGGSQEDGTRLSRFRFTIKGNEAPQLMPDSEEALLTWRSGGHNGANLQFGPDGMLYVSTGDATAPNPPDGLNTGQDNTDILSCVLRIDVNRKDTGKAYAIPKDNPYVGRENVRPEIWAFGFRNPWKMSFDSRGRLWLGDVGWELWEMIHLVEKGGNYGWSAMEAGNPIRPETASPLAPISSPVAAHRHTEAASMTGGFEYRGTRLPSLRGAYVYGDYETGKIWALRHDGHQVTEHIEIADTPHRISTFGVGNDGELYYIHYAGESELYRLKPNPRAGQPSSFPRKLSKTGLFENTSKHTPNPGVYAFAIQEPMWHDGATAIRYIALPAMTGVRTDIQYQGTRIRNANNVWPQDAVLAKTIRVGRKPIETQLMHFDGDAWNGYSYLWNKESTDAELVDANGVEVEVNARAWKGGKRYRIPGRAECMRCHSMWNKFTPAFEPMQLAGFAGYTNQPAREVAVSLGLTNDDFFNQNQNGHLQGSRRGGSLEKRARSWLHANCAHCHRRHGGGTAPLEVNFERAIAESFTVWQSPTRGNFGLKDPSIIVPGHPERSVLNYRVSAVGAGHMPPIGSREVDSAAAKMLWQWVHQMPTSSPVGEATVPADNSWLNDTSAAMQMARAIADNEFSGAEKTAHMESGLASPNHYVRALFERFRDPADRPLPAVSDPDRILALRGDPMNGKKLLTPTGKLAACFACHQFVGQGRNLGPELSGIGQRLNRSQILEGLLHPSKTIAPEYQVWNIETKDGEYHSGFITKRSKQFLELKLATGQSARVPTAQIKSNKPQTMSLMPEGMLNLITEQEAADLLAYLATLKSD